MSQKILRKKRQAASRTMPVETIRTRLKSSQLVSQHQKVSSNEITTKANETYMKRTKNVKGKSKEKHQELEETEINKEFYPDKLKRSFQKKEIVLKPKPTYKLVGGLNSINKRKLRKPIKGFKMSQKILRKKRQAASRTMPVETIRTRLKSSQLVSQHQKVSSNEITTKANETYMKRTKNVKGKSKEKHQELEETEINKEFYPDKLKRSFQKKEIVLKPKPTYKLVGGLNSINKRKLRKPIKEIAVEQEIVFQDQYAEDSNTSENTIDLICLDDSDDSLDEEDLMEILTCESPVWWEDPPDECYDEEPLSITMNNRNYNIKIMDKNISCNNKEHAQNKNQETKNSFSHKNNNLKRDKNFVARQNKLESLLGNIKNKKSNENTLENANNKISSRHDSTRQEKISESFDEAVLDEEFLKTLENMEIPMENTEKVLPDVEIASVSFETNKEHLETHRKQEINTESTFIMKNKSEMSSNNPAKGLTIKKYDTKQFRPKLNKNNVETSQKVQSIEEIDQNKMLFLKTWSEQCDMKVLSSNKGETEVNQSQPELSQTDNTVSGLTIKNFSPNSVQKTAKKRNRKRKSKINVSNEEPKKTQKKSTLSKNANGDDEITVYQIVTEQESQEPNDTKTESSKTYNTQLNSYYNQCKNITKTKKETDNKTCDSDRSVCNNKTVKSIPVSNNETVKYCLQCSSIFDNDTCNYCANKSNSDTKLAPNKLNTEAS